jgi:hypothetical protein
MNGTYTAHGSVVVESLCYKLEGRGFETRWSEWIFFNFLTPTSRTRRWGFTQPLTEMSTRSWKESLLGSELGLCVRPTTLPPSVSRLSRQCKILNISQPYRPLRYVTGIAILFFFYFYFCCHLTVSRHSLHKTWDISYRGPSLSVPCQQKSVCFSHYHRFSSVCKAIDLNPMTTKAGERTSSVTNSD